MEHIAALLLIIGCSEDLSQCCELPAPVPVYETSSPGQVEWILSDSGARALVVESAELAEVVASVRSALPRLEHVWVIDDGALDTLTSLGATVADAEVENPEPDSAEVRACLNAYRLVTGDDAKPYTIGGGTYARRFPNAVSFGPEHPERPQPEWAGPIHGVDEAASKEYFLEALKIYIIALLELEQLEF